MSGRRIKSKIACLLLVFLITGQTVYTSAFPFEGNPVIDSIQNLFGAIRYDVTIAELVVSLLTGAGATPVNNQMAMALETELGTSAFQVGAMYENDLFNIVDGVFTDNGFIDAIEDTAIWAQYNLADIFETTAEDVQAGIATVAGGGALNLGRALVGAIDTGFIIEMGATGGLLAGAAVGGFGLAYLIDHIRENWGGPASMGELISQYNEVNKVLANGGGAADSQSADSQYINTFTFTYGSNVLSVSYRQGNYNYIKFASNGGNYKIIRTSTFIDLRNDSNNRSSSSIYSSGNGSGVILEVSFPNGYQVHGDLNATDSNQAGLFLSSWVNGTLSFNRLQDNAQALSPDIIGKSGNMPHTIVQDGNGNDTVAFPDIVSPLEEGQGLKPISWNDYKDFVDEANQNYTDNPENQEDQIQAWDDFKDPYIEDTQDTPENPDNPDIPDNPDENYVPDFTDDITPDTVIDDVVLDDIIDDVVPDQPDIPDKPDLTPGEIEENLDVSVSGDITDIFPFCIPFDVIALFEKFGDIDREAPHFHFTLDFGEWGQYDVDINMEEWDNVATLCRTLELVIFILGLILITRELIKG